MTRLARGDVAMGAGIAATNAAALAARLRDLRAVLDAWLAELERRRTARTRRRSRARLRDARARLEALDVMRASRSSSSRARALPDAAGWYGLRTDGLEASTPLVAREGRFEPARPAMESTRATSRSSRTSCCATASASS